MKNIICIFLLVILLSGCSLCKLTTQTVKTAGTVVQTTGKVAVAGAQAAGKIAEAGGKTAEAVAKTPGAKEIITKKLIP